MVSPCLTLCITRYISRLKRSNPGKGVVPTPLRLGVVAIEKGDFRLPLTTVASVTFFLLYIDISLVYHIYIIQPQKSSEYLNDLRIKTVIKSSKKIRNSVHKRNKNILIQSKTGIY